MTQSLFSQTLQTLQELAIQVDNIAQNSQNVNKTEIKEKEIELMEPYYFNPKFKRELPLVYRFSQSNMRYYFTVKDKETNPDVTFYPSVTTIIDKTMPFSDGLKVLLGDKGYDGYRQFMNERANYGTFLHIQIADYFRSGDCPETRSYDLDAIAGKIEDYVKENRVKADTSYWAMDTKQDILAIKKFIDDYQVEPIAIELVGAYDDVNYRFAGAVDLICEMTVSEKGYFGEVYKTGDRKGEPKESSIEKRVTAIVDFKSGRNGFYENYEIQLHMYKMMIENMGFQIDKLYNVGPKKWEGEIPTYHIKDQSDAISANKIPNLMAIFNNDWSEPRNVRIISGKLNGKGISEVCKLVPAKDHVLRRLGINQKQNLLSI